MVAVLSVWLFRLAFERTAPPIYKRFFGVATGAMAFGFLGLWLPEHVLLACDHPLQGLHLHSWFHLLATASGYAVALWLAYHTLWTRGLGPEFRFPSHFPHPQVVPASDGLISASAR
jgi:hypothetical protein